MRSREGSEAGPGGTAPGQEEGTRWTVPSCRITRHFGSLLIAGGLRRGAPVGRGVVGGQGDQRTMTFGLSERLELLGEQATPAGAQESRQAPAQSLGGLLPGVVLEELAHGVSGEVVLRGRGQSGGAQLVGGPTGLNAHPPGGVHQPRRWPWSPSAKESPCSPRPGPLLPEARSEGSTRPSRTWRGWHSRSPEGPGHNCGNSILPRCHGCCGGSRGLPACLEVPQGEGEPHLSTGPHGPHARSWPLAGGHPGEGAGEEENQPVGVPAAAASLGGRGTERAGGVPRKDRSGSRGACAPGPAPGLLLPPCSRGRWTQPPGPTAQGGGGKCAGVSPARGAARKGSSPHAGGHRVPSRRPGWDASAAPQQSRSLGGPQPSRRRDAAGLGEDEEDGRGGVRTYMKPRPPSLPSSPPLRCSGSKVGCEEESKGRRPGEEVPRAGARPGPPGRGATPGAPDPPAPKQGRRERGHSRGQGGRDFRSKERAGELGREKR